LSYREIGRRIGRNPSTISREIRRGTFQQIDTFRKPYTKYFLEVGARIYKENRLNCGAHSIVMEAWDSVELAEKQIKEEWSPNAVEVMQKGISCLNILLQQKHYTSGLMRGK